MTTPKRLSPEELSEAFLTVVGDANFASDGYNAEQALKSHIAALEAELAKRERFKSYVHQRLDEAGVPAHPDGEHSKAGCRVGDRLDILVARLARAEERALAYFRVAQRSAEITPDDIAWANEQAARLGLSATPGVRK